MITPIILLLLFLTFFAGAISVAAYVLQSLALYRIAKRRGTTDKPWLAWIPYANVWLLGLISDQYQTVVRGKKTSRRNVLLGLQISVGACAAVYAVICVVAGLVSAGSATCGAWSMLLLAIMLCLLGLIPVLVLSIVQSVYTYVALYDLYRSCDPDNSVLYLVLGIVGQLVLGLPVQTIMMFICHKKDDGMKPIEPEPEICEFPEP